MRIVPAAMRAEYHAPIGGSGQNDAFRIAAVWSLTGVKRTIYGHSECIAIGPLQESRGRGHAACNLNLRYRRFSM